MSAAQPAATIGSTVDVAANSAFDEARLAAYLAGRIADFSGPMRVQRFEGGQSNPTFLLSTQDQSYVLRRKPAGILLKSAHAVDREYRITMALHEAGLPVAEPLLLCEDEDVIGSIFYVMRYVPGRSFWDPRMPGLDRAERAAIYDSANETLARLHLVDFTALGLADYGKPGNYFARQISRWSRQYEASRTRDIPEMDRLVAWLPDAVPATEERTTIIHGDYSFHNLLVHPTEPRVSAVIDWELSTLGDPLGDLTYHMMEWFRPEGVDVRGTLRGADLAALGIPTAEDYARRYCERTGLRCDPTHPFYRAFNLFRVAAILQGIAGRARDGVQTASNAGDIVTRIEPLAKAAWLAAQEAGAR
ncbi:phosphotransferase family protein [Sphingobium indicum]|uniref:Aminoglycoside phosphotransferase n=2 Tax=Sphingobium indicum TaxID=332055 RepID=A0A1L5BT69_SPHIB|nr:phosphotransferase family protein [Sphingobium indicum]APL96060.1 aminoglycoside phosphotransferase [Sphingobium indicum B90A]KEY99039.1 aminoglycoside phosphotransferase [Sphingomonas sp. BHC-A]NYI24176.1 aminoglycoside phosphotransferase (APT) family kinase protein [Sphingobium indicum]RYL99113.1 phosphotransferase family protein [Sphingobium indicum]